MGTTHQARTAYAALKAGGYKVVFLEPRGSLRTIASSYDEAIPKDARLATVDSRPTSSVVHTIDEYAAEIVGCRQLVFKNNPRRSIASAFLSR